MKKVRVNFEKILKQRVEAIKKAEEVLSPMIFEDDEAWDCFICDEIEKCLKKKVCKSKI